MSQQRRPPLPSALDAEKSIIGAILMSGELPPEVSEALFFNPDVARWFALLKTQQQRGLGVDLVSVIPVAQRAMETQEFLSFINLPSTVPSLQALPFWIKLLQQKADERALHQWANQIGEAIQAGDYSRLVQLRGRAAPATPAMAGAGQPRIQINSRDARSIVADCWEALVRQPVPVLFQQENRLVRLVESDWGRLIWPAPAQTVRALLNQHVDFVKAYDRKEGRVEEPAGAAPPWIAEDMSAIPDPRLPVLESVLRSPFLGKAGNLITEPGYHPEARCWLEPHHLSIAPMSVEAAKATIDHWLTDFAFAETHDKTNAVALFLLPFVRRYIRGPTPGHIIEASTPGSGKSLLASVLLLPSLGEQLKASPFSDVEEERRKGLMSSLIEGRAAILFDNLKGKVDSPSLEGVLTSDVWQDRVLGATGTIHAVNRATWVFTSNNAELSLDMARRCIRIRLDQGVERPFDREPEQFTHPDILQYTRAQRSTLVSAALALVQAWLEARGPAVRSLGSFEDWSRVVGGVLACAGYTGWLEGREEMIRLADRSGDQLRAFVEAWAGVFGGASEPPHTVRLVELAEARGLLSGTIGDGSDKSKQTRLGALLSKARGRVFSFAQQTWKIAEPGRDEKGTTWSLTRIDG